MRQSPVTRGLHGFTAYSPRWLPLRIVQGARPNDRKLSPISKCRHLVLGKSGTGSTTKSIIREAESGSGALTVANLARFFFLSKGTLLRLAPYVSPTEMR
jgi:hypothetical protein